MPEVTLPISELAMSRAWLSAWLAAVKIRSSRSCASAGLMACGSILTDAIVPSHLAVTFTAPPPLVASMVRCARSACTFSISCCIRAACFINFPMLDINLLSSHVHDLPFEQFEGFLDQWIISKVIKVQWPAILFGSRRRRDQRSFSFGGGRRRWRRLESRCRGLWLSARQRLFRFYETRLRVSVSQLLQLALEQRVRFGVVHQFHLIGKLGIKADRQDVFLERQGMRVAEITACKGAGSADGLEQLMPQRLKIDGHGRSRSRCGNWRRGDAGRGRYGPARHGDRRSGWSAGALLNRFG